ncbi:MULTISPECIES: MBL fold metallo-hydrolase [unclassified Bradyrhizobium]|uniref:MBL fold metallo-hydrolase n=1 Tax=unclassified Bradyrhizobium TaxID=2631580 RepID=UPI0028EEB19B|nr:MULTISPECIES: MBL fold metallo-hydrolase [unclassified Bradyrhizobium]
MANTVLYDDGVHKNILLEDFGAGDLAVQANQHLIIHDRVGMLLDPGGHKVYSRVLSETFSQLSGGRLKYLFLSHQDPDIVAAINGWLMTTDADAYISELWTRFVPHFGFDHIVAHRLKPIPDEGMVFDLAGSRLYALPAHFLHSEGNFQLYDPISKILYSGDLGASIGVDYTVVRDFKAHTRFMEGFHRRYMVSNRVMKAWAQMVSTLDIEIIAPQHGALFPDATMSRQFIAWCAGLECGIDLITPKFKVPVG